MTHGHRLLDGRALHHEPDTHVLGHLHSRLWTGDNKAISDTSAGNQGLRQGQMEPISGVSGQEAHLRNKKLLPSSRDLEDLQSQALGSKNIGEAEPCRQTLKPTVHQGSLWPGLECERFQAMGRQRWTELSHGFPCGD